MRQMPLFKIRASAAHLIMGRIGLTEKQEETLADLSSKSKLTDKQSVTLAELADKKANPELPQTAKSYLEKWYAESVFAYRDEGSSKYTEKGHWLELDAIDLVAGRLDWYGVEKNEEHFQDDFFTGTPDVIYKPEKTTLDTKCSWDGKTHIELCLEPLGMDYVLQGQVYMQLTGSERHIVARCLLDTPEELNRGVPVEFDATDEERVNLKSFYYDADVIKVMQERVLLCRDYLKAYDFKVRSVLGG